MFDPNQQVDICIQFGDKTITLGGFRKKNVKRFSIKKQNEEKS